MIPRLYFGVATVQLTFASWVIITLWILFFLWGVTYQIHESLFGGWSIPTPPVGKGPWLRWLKRRDIRKKLWDDGVIGIVVIQNIMMGFLFAIALVATL